MPAASREEKGSGRETEGRVRMASFGGKDEVRASSSVILTEYFVRRSRYGGLQGRGEY